MDQPTVYFGTELCNPYQIGFKFSMAKEHITESSFIDWPYVEGLVVA